MISDNSINEVKSKMDVLEIVGEVVKLKKVGSDYKGLCPFHDEKTASFSVTPAKHMYKCFGCGKSGDAITFVMESQKLTFLEAVKVLATRYSVKIEEDAPNRPKIRPTSQNLPLTISQYEWFDNRGIETKTLGEFKITNSQEWMPKAKGTVETICFNYFRDGELINVKYRIAGEKDFKLSKDAELILYNLDSTKGQDYVVIVEGEMDCLSVSQCGWKSVVSVPNGASTGTQRLDYLDNCHQIFDGKKFIVIMTDNDAPGMNLRDELARRIGYDRCFKVNYPKDCKDANDILMKYGAATLNETIDAYIDFPIEGIITMNDVFSDAWNYYHDGYPQGIKVGIENFDEHVSFMGGQYTTITGIPGSGKSEFADYIMVNAAIKHSWKFGVCSFENQPVALHVTKLIEKKAGRSFAWRENPYDRLTPQEFKESTDFIEEHFFFININQVDVTLDGILAKAKELVIKKGIKALLIDPWNYIEHKQEKGQTETQYISLCLTAIKAFCLTYGVHIFLIAHPTKIAKENGKYVVPTLYSISGSAHFFNKTDNGITLYRDFTTNIVDVHIQKVRYSWLGKIGFCSFSYDVKTRQYKAVKQPF